jgi:ribosomal protein L20
LRGNLMVSQLAKVTISAHLFVQRKLKSLKPYLGPKNKLYKNSNRESSKATSYVYT